MTAQESIQLSKNMITSGPGEIKGAFFRDLNTRSNDWKKISKEISEVYFLPDEEELSVEDGEAFVIKIDETMWVRADFYGPGQMTGPLVYAKVKSQHPTKTLEHSQDFENEFEMLLYMFAASFFAAVMSVIVFLTGLDEEYMTNHAALCIGIVAAAFFILSYWFGKRAYKYSQRPKKITHRDGQKALDILEEVTETMTMTIPLPPCERELVRQSVLVE